MRNCFTRSGFTHNGLVRKGFALLMRQRGCAARLAPFWHPFSTMASSTGAKARNDTRFAAAASTQLPIERAHCMGKVPYSAY